jgi:hypothetical protein
MVRTERRNVILFLLGLIAVIAGWEIGPGATPAPSSSVGRGQLVFPDLTAKLASVKRVAIEGAGKTMILRPRPDGSWGIEDRGLYPVQTDKLRAMLTGLTLIRQVEPRTTDPALYGKIGVENAGTAGGSSTQVTLFDAKGNTIASLIVGHRRIRSEGGLPDEIYIRRPGDRQSWLAQGALSVDADPQLWLQRDILSIKRERIAGVTVTRDATTLDLTQQDGKLTLTSPAEHPALDPDKLDDVDGALDALTLADVAPATAEPGKPIATSVFRTADGLAITIHLFRDGTNLWAQFAVAGKDAAPLQARLAGWTYRLGTWKEAQLAPTLADLEPTPAAGAPPTPPPAPAGPAPATPAAPASATPAPAAPAPTTGK